MVHLVSRRLGRNFGISSILRIMEARNRLEYGGCSNQPRHTPFAVQSNPFSTRCFRPGAIPFHFGEEGSLEELVRRADQPGRCHLIVGPHGTGKSTLLQHLYQHALSVNAEDRVLFFSCHKEREIPLNEQPDWKAFRSARWVFIDGLEQVTVFRRARILQQTRGRGLRCIATSHRMHLGCTALWQTRMDTQVEQYVVKQLLEGQPEEMIQAAFSSEHWRQSRLRHGSNMRESLFDMYDWWQNYEASLSERSSHSSGSNSR